MPIMQSIHTRLAGLQKQIVKAGFCMKQYHNLPSVLHNMPGDGTDSRRQLASSSGAVPSSVIQSIGSIQALKAKVPTAIRRPTTNNKPVRIVQTDTSNCLCSNDCLCHVQIHVCMQALQSGACLQFALVQLLWKQQHT